ncbi:uncharacterized protein ACHE_10838A [Aspergillus chevalieri]|uniref:GET complex, subunit GET2 n=1 Tax=Aspergillus chevalieri TaxID=182096 RepID=A0A7R7ZJM7_ASPCH|nr:uncharacterized protein ACHE_10838A [Aspergillus chevalieri]BCR83436.1 hypothetical protein ACHE_10838A [Aspergillus chevalieri]
MSAPEESAAQRSARLRRERREAKIKEGGTARLDKITSMSGRTPASAREDASPTPAPQPTSLTSAPRPAPTVTPATVIQDQQSPDDLQAQQEYFRALLRQAAPAQGQQQQLQEQGIEDEDPAVKLLHSILAGNVPGSEQGGAGAGGAEGPSQADLLSALGLPPFLSSLVGAATQTKSETEKQETWVWKMVHVAFALVMAVYVLVVIGTSVATYGSSPPPPATARNPFVVFTTGEMVLSGARMALKSRRGANGGIGVWVEMMRDAVRDGALMVFVLGMGTWWQGW